MPLYEYYCRSCTSKFELLRPMSESSKLATCPSGHTGATRSVSLVARPARGASELDFESESAGGGGCGGCGPGGCACGH
jgi:putative FmdB family regulatory protein